MKECSTSKTRIRRKKILFINSHLRVGGCERSLMDLVNHLDYSHYQVDLLLLERQHDYLEQINKEVHIIQCPIENSFGSFGHVIARSIKKRDWFSLRFRLINSIAARTHSSFISHARQLLTGLEKQYDLVVAYRPGICSDLAAFAIKANKRITWWHHGEFFDFGHIELSYKMMDYIVAVSDSSADIVRSHYPQFKDKVRIIPNMVCKEELLQESEKYAPPASNGLSIVTVGRMSHEKNIPLCIQIARVLTDRNIKYTWNIIGDGEEYDTVWTAIKESKLENRVILHGAVSNPYPYMKTADILVHPSRVESQGLTILEAIALSTPVVLVKSNGPMEYIEDRKTGFLVNEDPEEIADVIEDIYNGTVDGVVIAKNAIQVLQAFDPSNIVHKFEELI
ncbi:MAG: glycosyltransferase [Oscillospiraceae bacterium]|nr:glycosyltransferase [Oscillospiraceae bacterium]